MSFRTALSSTVLALGLLSASAAAGAGQALAQAPAPATAQHHRVLFALTSPEEADWNLTLGNIRNLLKLLPDAEVEVVAYGPGIMMVAKTSSVAAEITTLQGQHVKFVACQNAMRARKLTIADLIDGVTPVPAGIVEVVTKEEEGWTYIKAGR
jgi:intracellular sulfur oxidation DsrE/DsrF family protein